MQIGLNWIAPQTLPIIREVIKNGDAQFCEIMVDNVIHLSPEKIQAVLADIPVSFHIVASRFLEKSPDELKTLALRLREWIKILKPIYVSDHLVRYTKNNRYLPFITELNYEKDYAHIKQRVLLWQELLDTTILFENHASITQAGNQQAEFYTQLLADTKAELLFDFSNAYIAEHNQVCAMQQWDKLLAKTHYFHVGGFKLEKTSHIAIDTHDEPVANVVMHRITDYFSQVSHHHKSLVVELAASADTNIWQHDIKRFKEGMAHKENPLSFPTQSASDELLQQLTKENLYQRLQHPSLAIEKKVMDEFLQWTDENSCVMDWELSPQWLAWLMQYYPRKMNQQIAKELLINAATRFALQGLEYPDEMQKVFYSPHFPDLKITLHKSDQPDRAHKIKLA